MGNIASLSKEKTVANVYGRGRVTIVIRITKNLYSYIHNGNFVETQLHEPSKTCVDQNSLRFRFIKILVQAEKVVALTYVEPSKKIMLIGMVPILLAVTKNAK